MGEAGEHHSLPVICPVQVLMPLRGCVSFTISPCQPTYTYSLRTSALLKLSVAYISALPLSLSLFVCLQIITDFLQFKEVLFYFFQVWHCVFICLL